MIEYVMSTTIMQEQIFKQLARYDKLGLDIETRGLNPFKDEMLLLQLGWGDDVWVFDSRRVNLEPLFTFLRDLNPLIVGHNLSFDLKFLQHKHSYIPKRPYCTMSANAIIRNGLESPYVSLRELARRHADMELNKDMRDSFAYTYGDITQEQIDYAAEDVSCLDKIFEWQLEKLKKNDLVRTAKLEFEVLPVAVKMHLAGMKLDVGAIEKLIEVQTQAISDTEMQMAEVLEDVEVQGSFFGNPRLSINPRSPKQMKEAFAKFDIDLPNTQADTLRKIDHPLAKLLLQHREETKLKSTYGQNFIEHLGEDGRIHAEYNPLGTVTGRFSSSNPNMQNIPAKTSYRKCFVADEGNKIVTADFSQVELRLVAVMSGEQAMLDEYAKKDADLHQLTADKVGTTRSKAKNINFGTLYGISEYGLNKKFDIPEDEGKVLIEKFFKSYPDIARFIRREAQKALSQGYNTTFIGRRRYYKIPPVNDPDFGAKVASIKRKAGNTPIQGGAGEIMKRALVDVDRSIQKYGAFLVNTVHDELSVECPEENLAEVISVVKDKMMGAGEKMLESEMTWDIGLVYGDHWKKA